MQLRLACVLALAGVLGCAAASTAQVGLTAPRQQAALRRAFSEAVIDQRLDGGVRLNGMTQGLIVGATTFQVNTIATTSTDGIALVNNTAATAGVPVQQSPRLRFRSNVWNTTVTAANNTDDWWIESVPVSGTTPSGLLKFGSALNGGAATYPVAFTSSGNVGIGTTGPGVPLEVVKTTAGAQDLLTLDNPSVANGSGVTTGLRFRNSGNQIADIYTERDNNLLSIQNLQADSIRFLSSTTLKSGEVMRIQNNGNVGIGTTGPSGATLVVNGTLGLGATGIVYASATAPTIASGGCTAPAVTTNNGTATFKITIGTSCTGVKTFTLTMPAATNYWACDAVDLTTNASFRPEQSAAASGTSVVITNYARTTGLAIDFVAGEVLLVKCLGG